MKIKKIIIMQKRKLPPNFHPKIRKFRKRFLYLLYLGNKYYCPFCGRHYRKFLTFGKQRRSNMACPKDYSLDRHRVLLLYLKNETAFFKDHLKVLHFSPQYCFSEKFKVMTNLEYISTNLKSPKVMVNMDITDIIYEDNFFDVIICVHVLEHVLEDHNGMTELFRVLKPGGWAIIQSPIDSNLDKTYEDARIITRKDRKIAFGHQYHVRIYGIDFGDRLKNAGFNVKIVDYTISLKPEIKNKFRLNADDKIYFCSKPISI